MKDALQLLVADYLSLMKESGELDAFMPLLISGMGHQVLHTAQRGVREQGVDMASVGKADGGRKTLFMWVLKCGNVGRNEWNVGPQSVRHSLEDLVDVYMRGQHPSGAQEAAEEGDGRHERRVLVERAAEHDRLL